MTVCECFCLQAATICGVVTMAAFFAKVSDSSLGGTYMALLNTVAQFGV